VDLVEIVSITDRKDSVEALLRIADPRFIRTSAMPGIADEILRMLPGLARHRCECGSARGIAAELADTETAHLIEHVALELLVLEGAPRSLRGETRWDFRRDGRGVFRVTIGYDGPAGAPAELASSAVREATDMVQRLLRKGEST